ncbi:MAG: GTP-binding protein [Phycisphaerales bacterium]|nr:GTP-binding protein [Phycisphaerales bacterium]NNM27623.1 GTP-binding protein [Phycisphaerales bacterium]
MLTSPAPGAIAILHLVGDVAATLPAITGRDDWPVGSVRLVEIAGIDAGLVTRPAVDVAQCMPHGGPRVVQRILETLEEAGVTHHAPREVDPRLRYPEAADDAEALTLAAIARARSPLAIDRLLDEPRRWRAGRRVIADADVERGRTLDRLLTPPTVVLAGAPNVGKSTLTNTLLGRVVAIARDQPGTTRDYTATEVDLAGLVVVWHDTPGRRGDADRLERQALAIAERVIAAADYVVAVADPDHEWPVLSRRADLRLATKADLRPRPDADLAIDGRSPPEVRTLALRIRDDLVPPAILADPGRWPFDARLGRPSAQAPPD